MPEFSFNNVLFVQFFCSWIYKLLFSETIHRVRHCSTRIKVSVDWLDIKWNAQTWDSLYRASTVFPEETGCVMKTCQICNRIFTWLVVLVIDLVHKQLILTCSHIHFLLDVGWAFAIFSYRDPYGNSLYTYLSQLSQGFIFNRRL